MTQVSIAPGFGDRIRELRNQRLETQAEFAEALEVNDQTVYAWEKRNGSPTAKHLRRVLEVTGCSRAWLVQGKQES